MNKAPAAAQFTAAGWFKSSYSAADNECVEISRIPAWVGIRDSKTSGQDGLILSTAAFADFVTCVKSGFRQGRY